MLRQLINQHFKETIADKESVALLFSGGTDSLTCLYSLLDLDIKPKLYSFHLEGIIHKDIVVSKQVAEFYKLEHIIIEIKKDIEQLKEDVKYIIKQFKVTRKTNVQCTYPFLHILPHITEQFVVTGLCADDLYGSSKSASIKGAKDKEALDIIRNRALSDLNSSAYRPIKELVENYNKVFICPFRSNEIINYLMNKTWEEMNKPKQKQIALTAYEHYFNEFNVYRRNSSLQVESGIREWHSSLVDTELNKNNRHRVDEIYKDTGKEMAI